MIGVVLYNIYIVGLRTRTILYILPAVDLLAI